MCISKITIIALIVTLPIGAQARRHKKFKGVIIVNQILKLDGHVSKNGEDVPEYSGVKQGDLLETPEKSAAVIRIPGLAILKMGANTKFKLTQFNDRNEARFELLSGELLALFRRVGTHEVKLPKSVIKLHGTTFIVAIKEKGAEEVRLDDGKIEITLRKNPIAIAAPASVKAPEPTPVASPLFHASLSVPSTPPPKGAGIAKSTPLPTPSSTPVEEQKPVVSEPTPSSPGQVQMTATTEPQFSEVTDEGINLKPEHKLEDQQADIKELESLYALP